MLNNTWQCGKSPGFVNQIFDNVTAGRRSDLYMCVKTEEACTTKHSTLLLESSLENSGLLEQVAVALKN